MTRPGVVLSGGTLYWLIDPGGAETLDATGAPMPLANVPNEGFFGLAIGGGNAFVDDIQNVRKYDLATGAETEVATDDLDYSNQSMSAATDAVAWREKDAIFLWDATGKRTVATGITSVFATRIVLTSDSLFYTNDDGIHRVAR
jgi:hypothetical protein